MAITADTIYKIEIESGNFYLHQSLQQGENYSDVGLLNLHEIDILSRIQHPHIIHAYRIDRSTLVLPLADRSFGDLIRDPFLTTDQKLPIMYKLATGLEFLHRNQILHLNLQPETVVIKGIGTYDPLLIGFGSCSKLGKLEYRAPELFGEGSKQYTAAVDTWAYGMLMLDLLSSKSFIERNSGEENFYRYLMQFFKDPSSLLDRMLNGIRSKYYPRCKEFFLRVLKINPIERPTLKEICEDPLFEEIRSPIEGIVHEPEINPDYATDHRDALKLIPHWAGLMYPKEPVKLLFLATDLFHRMGAAFKDRSSDQRITMAATCLWMAAKLNRSSEIRLSIYLPIINKIAPKVTPELITNMELEIVQSLNGILNSTKFYRICKTGDEIKVTFSQIIMARDPTTYARTDPSQWITTITNPGNQDKEITIAELLRV